MLIKIANIMLICAGFILLSSGVIEMIGGAKEKNMNRFVRAIPGSIVGLALTMIFLSNIF